MKKRWLKPVVIVSLAAMVLQGASSLVYGAGTGKAVPEKPQASTTAAVAGGPAIDAKAAILMDAETGQVLFEQNADESLPPASMTKMMTEYLILENIDSGKLKWDETVPISDYSAFISNNPGFSGIPKAKGDTYTVKNLFYAVSIYSDNGAAIALAERIAGSEEKFAQMMNDTAQKIGLSKGAHFIDTSGLDRVDLGKYAPESIPGETTFSAKDAALIAYHLIKEHKEILDFSKIPSKKFRETDKEPMINWDWMLEGNKDNVNFKKYVYTGLDGLKTGHTDAAGFCFTGTAERNGMRMISVVMGTKSRDTSFFETQQLLDYGFNNFEQKQVVAPKSGVESLATVPVKKGVETSVPVVTESGVTFTVKKGAKDEEFKKEAQAFEESKLVAPIKQGDVVGTLTVSYNNVTQKVNLIAAQDVKKAGWFRLFFRAVKNFFGDLFSGIKKLL